MYYNKDLRRIYADINNGAVYGRYIENVRFPYFDTVLYKTIYNNIGWQHYGSSANKNTLKDLKWILQVIFKMSPAEFLKTYTAIEY